MEQDEAAEQACAIAWVELIPAVTAAAARCASDSVGRPVDVVGVRVVDADGRELTDALQCSTVLVGFRTT